MKNGMTNKSEKSSVSASGIKKGDKVKVDYEGSLDDGSVFDSSKHGDHSHPLEFEVGSGNVIKGFDDAVIGMQVGEEKTFVPEAGDAYGSRRDELQQKIPRTAVPQDKEPKAGMMMVMSSPEGHKIPVKITAVDADTITLDLNHPLAGKRLHFKITIAAIN